MANYYKKVDEEVSFENEEKEPFSKLPEKKNGRPPIKRDADGIRQVAYKKPKGEIFVQENASLLSGMCVDVFSKDGHSWWRDERGYIRALPKYETVEQLVEKIEDWEHLVLQKVKNGEEIIPDAEALAVGLDVNLSTLKSWVRGDRGEAFKVVIDTELNKIAAVKNQLAMRGAIPALVWTVQMNNVHGYQQNAKADVTITDKREIANVDDLINRAKLLP